MREDRTSNDEAAARDTADLLGASEHIGGGMGDQEPRPELDETNRCSRCEHGHGGHVCRWCIAEGKTA